MPSVVLGVFLRAIYTFKTLNCTVAYGLWGDFWHLGGGAWPPWPPLNPPMIFGATFIDILFLNVTVTVPINR